MPIPAEIRAHLEEQAPGPAVIAALEELLRRDRYLLEVDANERSISHRFGMYLQAVFPDFDVDCEYNRDGIEPKRLGHFELDPNEEDSDAKTVFPDVVVHQRGKRENYLVIEFKKSSSMVDREVDLRKLRGYKEDRYLRYRYALFLLLNVGEEPGVGAAQWL